MENSVVLKPINKGNTTSDIVLPERVRKKINNKDTLP